ncbi:hypothetical protein LEP3755_30500 [Leptolyngbya sp. NIES-3755]|nr:hypothetical protein LEP3755_30500 [Leptolyngbya sp. NIES-3755]
MNIVSRKTVTRCLLGSAIVLGCIIDNGRILKFQDQLNAKSEAKEQIKSAVTNEESRSTQSQSDSEIAMSRVKSGCTAIVSTRNNRPVRFNEGFRVFDPETFPSNPKTPRFDKDGFPINGVRPYPQGLSVCNTNGDTAIVGEQGAIHKIYRVDPSKLTEFRSYQKW